MEMDDKALESFLGAVMLDFHEHLMYPTNISFFCNACYNSELRASDKGGYICKPCNIYVHKDCVEINNLNHHKHPLKLREFIKLHDFGKTCFLCEHNLEVESLFYHCLICGFSLCAHCKRKPLVFHVPQKVHKHSLTHVMIDNISFTCDACGLNSHGFPFFCLKCCFIIHEDCIELPRVIRINRHDHRVLFSYLLASVDWICGVCCIEINRYYGGYSCSICRYAVHSKCATKLDVWDEIELEYVPEDENQDFSMLEVISEGLIKHFSHEHNLRLVLTSGNNERCYACSLSIYYDLYYTCVQCHFILHKTCANLPRKKRHELGHKRFTLYSNPKPREDLLFDGNWFICYACYRVSNGFRYKNQRQNIELDVRCAMVSDKFLHGSHPHSLFIPSLKDRVCSACDISKDFILSCVQCPDFFLCFKCATIPNEVIHKYDKHMLYLKYCGNLYGNYWCEICEKPTNPKKWFYSCDKCGSTLHIDCVLGIEPYLKPGQNLFLTGYEFQVVPNNHISRPLCQKCLSRCVDAFVIKRQNYMSFLCSITCLMLDLKTLI